MNNKISRDSIPTMNSNNNKLKYYSSRLVNASGRYSSSGDVQAVPRGGRGAPAGHAKNYKNQLAQGLDGGIWISKSVDDRKGGTTYRWTKIK